MTCLQHILTENCLSLQPLDDLYSIFELCHEKCERKYEENRSLYLKLANIAQKKDEDETLLKNKLGRHFTQTQVRVFQRGLKRPKQWEYEDYARALKIRVMSPKALKELRDQKQPIPSLRAINEKTKHIKLPPGKIQFSFNLMAHKRRSMTSLQSLIILSYDEMSLSSTISYSKSEDRVYPKTSEVQLIIARSLFGPWKLPVHYGLDENIDTPVLIPLIRDLYSIGFTCVGLTSDMGSSNVGFYTKMGVTVHRPYFLHPSNKSLKIFCFFDQCHILKNLRYSNFFLSNMIKKIRAKKKN